MNCFVTGANGFLGSALCARLEARGDSVIQGARRLPGAPTPHRVQFDLSGPPLAASRLRDVSCVFHLAGKAHALSETRQDEAAYFNINTDGTRKLLESCRAAGVRRFVFFSSVKAMGEGGAGAQDESAGCSPETPYGASKREAERLVLEGGYVPEPVVLRLSMVYGPTRRGNLPRMIEAVARGRFPPLPETGNRRSMVHVQDVVEAALRAARHPRAAGQTYIVTDGRGYSTRQIHDWICDALGKPRPGWALPLAALRLAARLGDGIGALRRRRFVFDSDALDKLIGSALYSSANIERELDFHPQRDLRSALPEIVAYLGLK
jgi:nucleoside-diphosphate-sugar epimerase